MVGNPSGDQRRSARSAPTATPEHALDVARAFAEIVRDEPVARELWVTVDTEEPGIHLWLITDPIDMDAIRNLYGTPVDRLYECFPEGDFQLHVLNPPNHVGDIHQSLRSDAEQISLRAS